MGGRLVARVAPLFFGFALACGSEQGTSPADSAESTATTSAAASAADQQAAPKPAVIPDEVTNLLDAIPGGSRIVVSGPSLAGFPAGKEFSEQFLPQFVSSVAKETGASEATIRAAFDGFDGFAGFGDVGADKPKPTVGGVLRFKDAKAVEDLLAELKPEKTAAGNYILGKSASEPTFAAWIPKPRLIALSNQEEALTRVVDTLSGKTPAFSASEHAKAVRADGIFAFGDLSALADNADAFAPGSFARLNFALEDGELIYKQFGTKVPRLSAVLAPTTHAGLGKLPGTPAMAFDLSLARPAGKTIADFLAELGRATGQDLTPSADGVLKGVGMSLADFDRALGDGLSLGFYVGATTLSDPSKLGDEATMLLALDVKDDAFAKKVFDLAKGAVKDPKIKFGEGKVTIKVDAKKVAVVELLPGAVVVAFGETALSEKLVAAYKKGDSTLAKNPAYVSFQSKATPSQLAMFVDYDQLMKAVPQDPSMKLPLSGATGSELVLNDSDKGVDAVLKGGAAVPVIGAMSALAIYGVRRYLSSAKGAEAKNTVGAIARGAVGAYEREQVSASGALKHALCQSAPPVPATVPSGTKYQADLTPGKDYDTGDDTAGWKCLKFMMTTPSYFQYEYRAGGPYKCVARGGPDPGPNGFEVSAEGDLDGDGKTSLFCQVGRVDGDKVTVGTQLFIADEGE